MTSQFDPIAQHASVAGAARSTRPGAASGAAWMQQFERALLSSQAPAPAPAGASPAPHNAGGAGPAPHDDRAPGAVAHGAAGAARAKPDDARPARQPQAPTPDAPQQQDAGNGEAPAAADAYAGAGGRAPRPARLPQALLPGMQALAGAPALASPVDMPARVGASAAPAALPALDAAKLLSAASVASVGPRLPLAPPMPAAPALAPVSEDSGASLEAPARQAPRRGAEQDPYALRLMHVVSDDAGVQAWIRDAALSQFQANALAGAIRDELHGSGLKLAALTVNGKKSVLPAPSALPKKK